MPCWMNYLQAAYSTSEWSAHRNRDHFDHIIIRRLHMHKQDQLNHVWIVDEYTYGFQSIYQSMYPRACTECANKSLVYTFWFISLLHVAIDRCEWIHASWSIVKVSPLQEALNDGDSKVEIGEGRNDFDGPAALHDACRSGIPAFLPGRQVLPNLLRQEAKFNCEQNCCCFLLIHLNNSEYITLNNNSIVTVHSCTFYVDFVQSNCDWFHESSWRIENMVSYALNS